MNVPLLLSLLALTYPLAASARTGDDAKPAGKASARVTRALAGESESGSPPPNAAHARALSVQADAAMRAGDFDDAARVYAVAALASPNDPVLRMLTGVALATIRKPDLAAAQFRVACRLTGDDLVASLLLQGALSESGQTDEAQRVYLEAVRRYGTGGSRLDSTESLIRLRRALSAAPQSPVLHLLIGDAYQVAENDTAAAASYQKAIQLAPHWAKPKVNWGLSLTQTNPEVAITLFEKALRRDPDNVQLLFFRADAERKAGKLPAAIRTYQRIETRPAARRVPAIAAQALTGLGQAYAAGGQYSDAATVLNEARTLAPRDPAPPTALGELQSKQRAFGDAANSYDDALRLSKASGLFETQPVLYQALAQAQIAANQPRAALENLARAESDEPANFALWERLRAEALLLIGDNPGAETAYRAAIDRQIADGVFPQQTLASMRAHGLTDALTAGYRADAGGETGRESSGAVSNREAFAARPAAPSVTMRPPSAPASLERAARAHAALAALAQYNGDVTSELRERETLTQTRHRAGDFLLLAEAYEERARDSMRAKAAYQQALNIGGLNEAQTAKARARVRDLLGR